MALYDPFRCRNSGRIPFRETTLPGEQVGEGDNPLLMLRGI